MDSERRKAGIFVILACMISNRTNGGVRIVAVDFVLFVVDVLNLTTNAITEDATNSKKSSRAETARETDGSHFV